MTSAGRNPIEIAESWLRQGHAVALATVVETLGSAPRGVGSHMVIRADGGFAGSVSGGCAEASIIDAARVALQDGKLHVLEFGIAQEPGWDVGLACGGRIKVMIEPLCGAAAATSLGALNAARRANHLITRAVDLATGESTLIAPGDASSPLAHAAAEALRTDRSAIARIGNRTWFFRVYSPPISLDIIGAVHIAQSLASMAGQMGYRVRVIDPRTTFATAERFPNVTLIHAFPDEVLQPLTSRSAVVALSHDPKIDDPAIAVALHSPAFYVGALGSKRTHAARLARLHEQGLAADALARVHGPVGLAIGSKTPAEIAVSILAEITQIRRQPA